MKDILKLGITLMVICALAGAGLAVVYANTKPVIEQRAKEDLVRAAREAIPGADTIEQQEKDGVVYWIGKQGGEVVGAAMKVSSQGYGSNPIEMIVGVDRQGRVTKVTIISISETPGIGTRVKDEAFLQSFAGIDDPSKVDGISGATLSSRAVKGGVQKASEFLSAIVAPRQPITIDLAKVPDGTYEGSADGLMGPIRVSVTVAGGKIVSVTILSQNETPSIASGALQNIPKAIVAQQKIDVDAVSGATFTSKGIIQAVKNALAGH